jgi:predicted O-methyltransferase YrrM
MKMKENTKAMDRDLASGVVFERFNANIKHAHPEAPITFQRKKSADAFAYIPGLFDFIFLDGCHRYTEVCSDILYARRSVRVGGILAGDDLERQGKNVYDHVYPWREQDTFEDCHAGVTCAVWEAFGEVFCDRGIWAVRRADARWERLR